MSTFLEEAAAQLRKAAGDAAKIVMSPDRAAERRRIAEGFTRLAAIEGGLLPPDWQPDPAPATGEQPRVN